MKSELEEALEVRAWLQKALADKGEDYVYEYTGALIEGMLDSTCMYAVYDEENHAIAPSCLVGHVFTYAGVPLSRLNDYEGTTVFGIDDSDLPIRNPRIASALDVAQATQDARETWGSAVNAYDEYCGHNIDGYKDAISA